MQILKFGIERYLLGSELGGSSFGTAKLSQREQENNLLFRPKLRVKDSVERNNFQEICFQLRKEKKGMSKSSYSYLVCTTRNSKSQIYLLPPNKHRNSVMLRYQYFLRRRHVKKYRSERAPRMGASIQRRKQKGRAETDASKWTFDESKSPFNGSLYIQSGAFSYLHLFSAAKAELPEIPSPFRTREPPMSLLDYRSTSYAWYFRKEARIGPRRFVV